MSGYLGHLAFDKLIVNTINKVQKKKKKKTSHDGTRD